jgi:hypothetical protein
MVAVGVCEALAHEERGELLQPTVFDSGYKQKPPQLSVADTKVRPLFLSQTV